MSVTKQDLLRALRSLPQQPNGEPGKTHYIDLIDWVEAQIVDVVTDRSSAILEPVVVSDTASFTADWDKMYIVYTDVGTPVVTVSLPAADANSKGKRIGVIYANQDVANRLNERVDVGAATDHTIGIFDETLGLYVAERGWRDKIVVMSEGDSSQYWLIEDGRTRLRWEDYQVSVVGINPPGSARDPDIDSSDGLLLFDKSRQETLVMTMQLHHAWREGTPVYPHVHWCKTTSASGLVLWECVTKPWPLGAVPGSGTTSQETDPTVEDDDTANQHALTAFAEYATTGLTISEILHFQVSRRGDDGQDTYGADAKLIGFDVHYLRDDIGSFEQFHKAPTNP